MLKAFEFAVIGPTGARRMGIAAGCSDCRESQRAAPRCNGFGAGCLGFRAPLHEEASPRDAKRER
ncbi:MAG TPA: hypothetical protein VFP44_23500 [Usitatibacter sp.]|nr:hypothetical protein [Usitatibacter sp.]